MIEEIENAISVHMAWLKNIKTVVLVSASISKKNSDPIIKKKTITRIESDHQCVFGKWLYQQRESDAGKSIYYNQTVILHAHFHKQAANILSLTFEGKKSEARSLILDNSDFIQCSEKLIETLNKWKDN